MELLTFHIGAGITISLWLQRVCRYSCKRHRICIPENSHKMLHGPLCACGWNGNRFANFGLWIAPKCVWRPGSARTRWGSYGAPPGP